MRAVILVAMLVCSSLIVPLTVLVIQQLLQAPSAAQFESNSNSGFNMIRDTLVKPQEPGSGGGASGVI